MYSSTEYHLLETLANEPDEIKDFVSIVFENNGFIAGGFATCAARLKHKLDNRRRIFDYLSFLKGDIDVYFENKEDLQRARIAVENRFQSEFYDSYTKFALNMTCLHKAPYGKPIHLRFSLIQGMFSSPEETLDSFDITNAKVAITKNAMIMHPAWLNLESKLTLDVSSWNCQYEFQRIKKWIHKWNYEQLTARTASNAYDYAEKLLADLTEMQVKIKKAIDFVRLTVHDPASQMSDLDAVGSMSHLTSELNTLEGDKRTIRHLLTSNVYTRSISIDDVDKLIGLLYTKTNDTYNFSDSVKKHMLKCASEKKFTDDEFSSLF